MKGFATKVSGQGLKHSTENGYRMKFSSCFVLTSAMILTLAVDAQAQLTRGFDRRIPSTALNAEVIRQPSLQVMEVQIKLVRLAWVDPADPKASDAKKAEVWYLVWRAINRPLRSREGSDTLAVNQLDPLPGPMQFIPQFTLVTYDDPNTEIPNQILPDQVLPGAIKEIERIERVPLNNSVSVIQDFPETVAEDAEKQPWIYGVATWKGVDPKTDHFKILMTGFSNGYENKGTIEEPEIWRKIIVQRFYRPGDEFDPTSKEFQFKGEPEWTYQPERGKAAPEGN